MTRLFFLALATSALLTSCETTGDPNQGGLFGWSQNKANDRIAVREQHLSDLENENAYQRGRTRALEEEKARRERQLEKSY